ncbi:MAG: DUF58 domain-containing protein [Bacteroidia bacterium]|nr:DUF58 domain-containing protein [Bacteroidia bacterium]MDW8235179.1 DUF58 domain-containing protein [Bacteroidia bacterium]
MRRKKLSWRFLHPVASLLVGPYRSFFKGEGIEFADARPYEPGDDWRRIHWSLTARKNQPYLRLGQEERELTCILAIDRSPSMNLHPAKQELTWEAAMLLALSAWINGDRVRWLSFTNQIEYFSPAQKGESFIWAYLDILRTQVPRGRYSLLSPLLQWVLHTQKKRSLLIVLSDMFFHEEPWNLLQAVAMKHFVLMVNIHMPEEQRVPHWGYVPLREVEKKHSFILAPHLTPSNSPQPRVRWAYLQPGQPILPALHRALSLPLV